MRTALRTAGHAGMEFASHLRLALGIVLFAAMEYVKTLRIALRIAMFAEIIFVNRKKTALKTARLIVQMGLSQILAQQNFHFIAVLEDTWLKTAKHADATREKNVME